ncbi:MAG: DUF2236 domain-containing protein [Acidimicrobiaceae bacterium]|nr:DUF2236 domain-containing protein [Acidimicrobiaceae bacterium]
MGDIDGEFGIFGPGSLAWKIHAHPSGWIGAIRALLIQALEPRAMAGVAQFSRFSEDAWKRFSATSEFIMTVTYRPRTEAENAIAQVRKIHQPVVGVDPNTSQQFSANDPYLLAYIHNSLVDSLLAAYLNFAERLSKSDQDQYVKEMFELAELIGADASEVPGTAEDLTKWLSSCQGLLLTPEAKLAAETVRNINLPPYFRQIWSIAWNASLSILPPYALELYGFEIGECPAAVYKELAGTIARTLRLVLPSHPYYRQAKYSFYDFYSRNNGRCWRSDFGCPVKDLISIVASMR